jgi:hypothetical protein
MIRGSDCNINKILFSLLILSGLTLSLFSQDKQISGVINVYKHVTAVVPGTDNVTLDNVDFITAGDTVLLIQMKGAIIYEPETGSYGSYRESIGVPGSSEFLIVQSVDPFLKNVIFSNNIIKNYDAAGIVQLIKVPFYNSASVKADLACQPWDSITKTGGVLAMIVGRTLSLDANIDVTGKGFVGGDSSLGDGICIDLNPTLYDKFSYPGTYLNSGYKGESQVIKVFIDVSNIPSYFPAYAKGKGNNFTGGGGGNGKFSGGGGGSNYGTGGTGGREINDCAPTQGDGGLGGRKVKFTDIDGGIFLGSGGGSSTYISPGVSTPGGRGGGIIMILCDTLKGNGKIIKAEGGTPLTSANGNAGAGGGGGGGSIALYQQSFSTLLATSAITISANGGKGGDNIGQFGEGGGGGGGFILTNNITIPGNVALTYTGGAVGTRSGTSTGGAGSIGESLTSSSPTLNGFLFNSVRSSVTGNLVDSVCSNMLPPKITGTKPVGGTGPYTYLWEKSYDKNFGTPLILTNNADPTNYISTVIESSTVIDTIWFRRTITDSSVPTPLIDISKSVMIIIQPAITGNLVGKDTIICYNQNPLSLIPLNAGPANGSIHNYYEYKWIQNLTNTSWNTSPDAAGTVINPGYDPPNLTNTTYYQRIVTSGRCVNYSSTVTITVLPSITGNITTRPDSIICEGNLFNNLGASAPGGGDLTYKYQWQDSTALGKWTPSKGINDGLSYSGDTSTFSVIENRYFRRVVFSGPDNVCRNNSSPIRLTRYHKIKNNSIQADQTICSGSFPLALSGSTPTKGSGVYTYVWQDSSKAGNWATRGTTDFSFSPPVLTDTTWYRRIVNSSKCTNTSLSIRVNVHIPILNNNISLLDGGLTDTTICNGAVPHQLKGTIPAGGTNIPGDYAYQWKYSTDNSNFIPVPSGGTGVNYQPPALAATTYYKRQVQSGTCILISSTTITVTVLPLITNNIISDNQTICFNTSPVILTGTTLSGGAGDGTYSFLWEQSADGTTWSPADGTNDLPSGSYQPPVLTISMKYRRVGKSGAYDCCINISNVIDIEIYPLPLTPIYAGPDTTLFSFDNIFHMVAYPLLEGETGLWTLVSGTGDFDDNSNNSAEVRNLSKGINTFLWTVTYGPCTFEDSVSIDVYDIFIPQGFSPNNDPGNYNNTFIISGLDLPNQVAELTIVNGAGTEVFSTTNLDGREWTEWVGTNSKGIDLPEGTYYYLIKIISKGNGQVFKKSGFIVLKRY